MTKQTLKHFAIAIAMLGPLLSTSPSLAQSAILGLHLHRGQDAAQRIGEVGRDSSREQALVPGTFSVTNFGTIDFPGAPDSLAVRVNNKGRVVGGYGPDTDVILADSGFVLTKDSFKTVNFPAAAFTQCMGINDAGEVVGTYIDTLGNYHGFSLVSGVYSSIDVPGSSFTIVLGINDSDEIVGGYTDSANVTHGFSLVGGVYTTIDPPGSTFTEASGVNKSGEIVGDYTDASGTHGFSLVGSTYTTIDYPGAVISQLAGLNDQGVVVGAYGDNNPPFYLEHGYMFYKGQYLSVDVPFAGAGATAVIGINNSCQIVGDYIDTALREWGFSATFVP